MFLNVLAIRLLSFLQKLIILISLLNDRWVQCRAYCRLQVTGTISQHCYYPADWLWLISHSQYFQCLHLLDFWLINTRLASSLLPFATAGMISQRYDYSVDWLIKSILASGLLPFTNSRNNFSMLWFFSRLVVTHQWLSIFLNVTIIC